MEEVTGFVRTEVCPEVEPAYTIGLGVAINPVLLDVNVTLYAPFVGVGPLSVTVPTGGAADRSPPTRVEGEIVKAVSQGGFTVIVACRLTAPCVAVIVTVFGVAVCKFV